MFRALSFTVLLILTSYLSFVSATCYGLDACLEGWVWRQAIPTDHVCVTPEVRTQTAEDNAAAASRVNPNGGPYGPDTCKDGYVWREAYTNDHVCVLPATRTEAADDNAQASNRVASLNLWTTDWYPGPDTYPYFKVNGDHFNLGSVQVAIFDYNNNNVVQDWTTVTASSYPGYVGGAFGIEFQVNDCAATDPTGTKTGYVIAQDVTSGCYSQQLPIDICYSL